MNKRPSSTSILAAALAVAACSGPRAPGPSGRAPMVAHADTPAVVHPPMRRPAPEALAPVDDAWVERTLASLSLREKAGQMILAWIDGHYRPDEMPGLYSLIDRYGVGGFIVSIGGPREFAEKMNALQARSRVPLLMVTDLESGPGMRLRGPAGIGGTNFPPGMGLAATGSDSLAYEVGKVIGEEGRAVGLHLTISPVLDVNSNPRNPIINTRSFGEDPVTVGRFAADEVRGIHAGGLLAMGKHFPGHGDTHTDSHMDLPRVDVTRDALEATMLPPFRAAIAAGLDAMLVGHIAVPNVTGDDVPSSINTKVTGSVLRSELGFRGLVSTDAMNMGGLTRRYSQGQAAVMAIRAGADLLLQPTDIPGVVDSIVAAVHDGRLTEARIDQSVRRILAAKTRVGLNHGATVSLAEVDRVVGAADHRRLAAEVAERSITLARDRKNLVPLAAGARRILSVTYTDTRPGGAGRGFDATLAAQGRDVTTASVDNATTAGEFAALRARAEQADVVIVSAYVTPLEYKGTVEAASAFDSFVQSLAQSGRPVIAVSFGSPYLLSEFPDVPAYVLAWGGDAASQLAAARALLGLAPISGRLPVTLAADAPRGAGIMRGESPALAGR